ncbi:hypothetical protein B194_3022 [Serratia plymuthica A30]|nr:hypothetical protein B194_3022 [Serratia plymuthica A30]
MKTTKSTMGKRDDFSKNNDINSLFLLNSTLEHSETYLKWSFNNCL